MKSIDEIVKQFEQDREKVAKPLSMEQRQAVRQLLVDLNEAGLLEKLHSCCPLDLDVALVLR